MKVVSKFFDYYDSAVGFSADDSPVYIRHERREKGDDVDALFEAAIKASDWRRHGFFVRINTSVLLFCGQPYVFVVYKDEYFWSHEAYKTKLQEVGGDYAKDELDTMESGRTWRGSNTAAAWARLQEALNQIDWEPIHRKYQSPVMVLQEWCAVPGSAGKWPGGVWSKHKEAMMKEEIEAYTGHVIVNPFLRDMGFASVVDPFTAYQEIDVFLGNVLTSRESGDRVRTSEEIRDSHGFDAQSFVGSQAPTKKQRRKMNKKKKRS